MVVWDLCQHIVMITFISFVNSVFFFLSTGQYTKKGHCSAHSGEERAAGGAESQERWYCKQKNFLKLHFLDFNATNIWCIVFFSFPNHHRDNILTNCTCFFGENI